MHHSDYVMSYFHPRDFDPGQPVLDDLSAIRRFKSYVGLSSSLGKLERLIQDFNFVSLNQADKKVDWHNAKNIQFQSESKHKKIVSKC